MLYFEGTMLLARSNGIGTTAIVPFSVPVTLFEYWDAIGFGDDSLLDPGIVRDASVCAASTKHIERYIVEEIRRALGIKAKLLPIHNISRFSDISYESYRNDPALRL